MSSPENKNSETHPEEQMEYVSSCALPMPWATFQLHAFVDRISGKEHLALVLGDVAHGEPVLARVHSECLTGDALFSQRCDCGAQLEAALKKIAKEKRGVLFYLRQEGRGIGLLNKVRAYHLQDGGADTVEANQQLGFAADLRRYTVCLPMLEHLGIKSLRLMTNNPRKVAALEECGINIAERIGLVVNRNPFNIRYLGTKAAKLGHLLPSHDNE
ncbi:GTP cyclohydrolase II [Herbaspirillum autotrophicum]|uniref:GTP cyclohydrolase II n=1 Tax=Herbaspirillum autotrophicum TaxID=180195 RepID=UPI00067C4316|nr:GTP cyclohydrolase II [Herbaspirillum autotrophicum]